MARPYPREFRDDVVRVARNREGGVTIEQIATDFGVHPMTLTKWIDNQIKNVYLCRSHRVGRRQLTERASRPSAWCVETVHTLGR